MNSDHFPGWDAPKDLEIMRHNGKTIVMMRGRPYIGWKSGDEASKRMAIVQLSECGLFKEEKIAQLFGITVRSVQRYLSCFNQYGIQGLIPQHRGPSSNWKLTTRLRAKILWIFLKEGIFKLEDIQKRLEQVWNQPLSLSSIRQVLLENGLSENKPIRFNSLLKQRGLFERENNDQLYLDFNFNPQPEDCFPEPMKEDEIKTESEETDFCLSIGVKRRRRYSQAQRVYLDRLEQGDYNAYAGALLFIPLLEKFSFLPTLRRVIDIPTYEGYSLEELCLTLFYFDVFGFRSMEDFKRAYPEEFGVLIGRSYSPSLFTLRRFLHKVRALQQGERVIEEFSIAYLKSGMVGWGVLYIDGHFLPYHGARTIKKGWHGVLQKPMKGSYNFLGVDEKFNPWIFLIRSSSEDLLQKIPEIIEKSLRIGKEAGLSRKELDRLIVVFDREGYSAELFRYFDGKKREEGVRKALFITWAKYSDKWTGDIPEERFDKTVKITFEIQKPEEIKYFETDRMMSKYGKIRAIVIQSGRKKKRAVIYTNGKKEEIKPERIIQLICRRWGEENLIKELMTKHLINYMPGYVIEEMENQPMVDNPKVKELKKQRARLKNELSKLKIILADSLLKKGREKSDWEEIKRSGSQTLEDINRVETEIFLKTQNIEKLPAEVRFDQAYNGEMLMKLNYEKKRFLDCIKVFTYNIKKQMCHRLLNHFGGEKEVLPALSMIVERAGHVKMAGGELRVSLRRFKNQEIDYAARRLCEDLNSLQPTTLDKFRLPIYYEVQ